MRGLKFDRTGLKREAVTFGSMGGKGGAPQKIKEDLQNCGFEVSDLYEIYYVPTEDEIERCYKMGSEIAVKMKNM
jgi:flavorubredoxin